MASGQLVSLLVKGLAGGTLVSIFAVAGEVFRPRDLAGITAAAPSVAIASLAVTLVATGRTEATAEALGMIAGAVALVVWCLVALDSLKRFSAARGSILATVAWLVAALGLWQVALR